MSTLKSEPSWAGVLALVVLLVLASSSRSLPWNVFSFILVSLTTSLAKYSTWAFKAALDAMSSSWDMGWDSFDMVVKVKRWEERLSWPWGLKRRRGEF
ncbi:unnamed protein product [Cuscuta campestris]|uniref:Uncharacterized protein n=1 Tax=Cuscuta campestris TaxID=132261 RepID=A0A484LAN7_9ASTE|nr:unnamed protein product [Cuscuta campestris]